MKKHSLYILLIPVMFVALVACNTGNQQNDQVAEEVKEPKRIVSLNGTITEILFASGKGNEIVGVDVTSTYPTLTNELPKLGHSRNLQAEGIIALAPDIVYGKKEELKPELIDQLKAAGIDLQLFEQEYTIKGTKKLISDVLISLGVDDIKLFDQIEAQINTIELPETKKKVLFIYARGAGTMMVAGDNTPMNNMIVLAGAENAAQGFSDFKPLTTEALIASNPDAILLFTTGYESLGGEEGLLAVPGIAQTNAGINKSFIAMDGQYLSGFGPRLADAVVELHQKIYTTSLAHE